MIRIKNAVNRETCRKNIYYFSVFFIAIFIISGCSRKSNGEAGLDEKVTLTPATILETTVGTEQGEEVIWYVVEGVKKGESLDRHAKVKMIYINDPEEKTSTSIIYPNNFRDIGYFSKENYRELIIADAKHDDVYVADETDTEITFNLIPDASGNKLQGEIIQFNFANGKEILIPFMALGSAMRQTKIYDTTYAGWSYIHDEDLTKDVLINNTLIDNYVYKLDDLDSDLPNIKILD